MSAPALAPAGSIDPSRVVAHFEVEMNPVPRSAAAQSDGRIPGRVNAGFRIEIAPRGIDVRLVMYHLGNTECVVPLQAVPNGRGRFYMSELLPRKIRCDGVELIVDLVIVNLNAHGGPAAALLGGGGRLRVWASPNFPSQQIDLVA